MTFNVQRKCAPQNGSKKLVYFRYFKHITFCYVDLTWITENTLLAESVLKHKRWKNMDKTLLS